MSRSSADEPDLHQWTATAVSVCADHLSVAVHIPHIKTIAVISLNTCNIQYMCIRAYLYSILLKLFFSTSNSHDWIPPISDWQISQDDHRQPGSTNTQTFPSAKLSLMLNTDQLRGVRYSCQGCVLMTMLRTMCGKAVQ